MWYNADVNENHENLIEYFTQKGATQEKSAIGLEGFSIPETSAEELKRMILLMSDEFHQTNDGRFWYEKTPFKITLSGWQTFSIIATSILLVLAILLRFLFKD